MTSAVDNEVEIQTDDLRPVQAQPSPEEMQNYTIAEELVRCYNEVETATQHLFLASAGKHPINLSIYAQTLATHLTISQNYKTYLTPLLSHIRAQTVPIGLVLALKVWKIAAKTLDNLKVGEEILHFVNTHHKPKASDNPHHPINKTTEKQQRTVATLAAMQGASDLPDWGFSTTPSDPTTAHPLDPCWGKTDVWRFGRLLTDTLKALRVLCDSAVTLDDANTIYLQYKNVWVTKNNKRSRKSKKAKAARRSRKGSTRSNS